MIQTDNDIFYFLFVNNHLPTPVNYVSMWRASRGV